MMLWWLLVILVTLLTIYVVKRAVDRTCYPPGPLPLPIIGNILAFRGVQSLGQTVHKLRKRYGDVITLWMGNKPLVFVCSWEMAKEGLVTKRNHFSGRMRIRAQELFLEGHTDIAFSDPSPTWEVLRKIGFSAVRKYTPLPQLRDNSCEMTDLAIGDMLKEDGPFDPREYLQSIVFNIIAFVAFQLRCDKGDQDREVVKRTQNAFPILLSKGIPGDFIPLLRLFEAGLQNEMKVLFSQLKDVTARLFKEHQEAYNGEVRDFTDAVLAAREEADPSETGLKELTDGELLMAVNNLFNAGVVTTRETISWVFLLLGIHLKIQEKVAQEVLTVIGDRQPSQEDRKLCPYTVAVVNEVLRYRSPVPVGLPHKALCDTTLGGFSIPKDTAVLFVQENVHFDALHWGPDPERFRPERFLDDPEATRSHYMPFGIGRRNCIGERLALTNLFLMLARLVQRCSWRIHGEPDDGPDPAAAQACFPKPYKVIVSER